MGREQGDKLDIVVMYVEDEPATRDMIARMLKREVRALYLAENGKEGLELFMRHRPDVVVTDIRMPVMNGLDMAEQIKGVDPRTQVIVTSAHGETGFFQKSIEIGIDRYLLKPVDAFKLHDILAEMARNIRLERALKEQALLLAEYKRAVDESNIVCKTDKDGRISYINDAFCRISGYAQGELLGKAHDAFLDPEMRQGLLQELRQTILSRGIWKGTLEYRTKNQQHYFADVTIVPLLDLEDNILEFIYIGHDITTLLELSKRLKELSCTDALTRIYNRMAFNDMLQTELNRAQRYQSEMSLIMFDIDHFKQVNDTAGHMAGDELLRQLAELVTSTVRKEDLFARIGGEEFAVLVPEGTLESARTTAERLRNELAQADFEILGVSLRVTASFGVAALDHDADRTGEKLRREADERLYAAKEAGRDRVVAE
jgi:diguanylate cyclase (GGDEF)-like protein/PAS domain S-box-containing protein